MNRVTEQPHRMLLLPKKKEKLENLPKTRLPETQRTLSLTLKD